MHLTGCTPAGLNGFEFRERLALTTGFKTQLMDSLLNFKLYMTIDPLRRQNGLSNNEESQICVW